MLVPRSIGKGRVWLFVEQIELNLVKWFSFDLSVSFFRLRKEFKLNFLFSSNFFLIKFNHKMRCIELTSTIKVWGFFSIALSHPDRWITYRFVSCNWLWIEQNSTENWIKFKVLFWFEGILSSAVAQSIFVIECSWKIKVWMKNFFSLSASM